MFQVVRKQKQQNMASLPVPFESKVSGKDCKNVKYAILSVHFEVQTPDKGGTACCCVHLISCVDGQEAKAGTFQLRLDFSSFDTQGI